MVSGYPTSTSILQVDRLLTDPRDLGRHRYIRPFEVLKRVGIVAYQLALPSSLSGVHEVFHVSMLRKYTPDPANVVDWGEIIVDINGTFEEGPSRILDCWDQILRSKTLRLVKVLWKH